MRRSLIATTAAVTLMAMAPTTQAQEAPKPTLAHIVLAASTKICKTVRCETDFADLAVKAAEVELAAHAAKAATINITMAAMLKIDTAPARAKAKEAQEHFQKLSAALLEQLEGLKQKYGERKG